jgi:hypothetical protein
MPRRWLSNSRGHAATVSAVLAPWQRTRLTIKRIEGNWKLSQNRRAEDRAGAGTGLEMEGKRDVAELIRALSPHVPPASGQGAHSRQGADDDGPAATRACQCS